MKSVAMVLFPDILMLDVAGPLDVFSIANRYLSPSDQYKITTIGIDFLPLPTTNGLALIPQKTIDQVSMDFDYLLVPGGPGAYNQKNPILASWLAEAAQQSKQYGSICTGAFLLGEAGLLDGYHVTTHWNYSAWLAKEYPKAFIETDKIYLRDRKLITSGGVTAGIDLALSIVTEDYGKCVSLDVAKVLLVTMKRQGLQTQFSPLISTEMKVSSQISEVQSFVLQNIADSLSTENLAQSVSMSKRNFTRVFVREMGVTPTEFVQNTRVDHARNLLESTEMPIKTIAYHSGFGDDKRMREVFNQKLGLSPSQYRKNFSG
ncbi:GlxA family transcriptional regulator [Marinomonas lutimaris]|uniref:GlxA family transcriptional regulator n=1 Tax=Marinomonas lutimaris TaxID=2846746 RepID=UPI001C66CD60|nr:GlxA family transcriptional regulator [Marinomonas lutimaris]